MKQQSARLQARSFEKGVLRNFAKFTRKQVPKSLLKKSLPKSLLIEFEKDALTEVVSL